MDKETLAKYQEQIGNEYTIKQQLGRTGANSIAFLVADANSNENVIKTPTEKHLPNIDSWQQRQSKGYDFVSKEFADFKGELELPQITKQGYGFIVEEYLGEDLEISPITNKQDRQRLAKQLGEFLSYCHRKSNGPKEFNGERSFTYAQCLEFLDPVLTEKEKQTLQKKINAYNTRDKSDEVATTVHGDIRAQNITHNKSNGKFALIDPESFREGCIYDDFVPNAPGSFGSLHDVLWGMVDEHNKSSNHKVDIDKVKLFHELGIVNELCRAALNRNRTQWQKIDKNQIKSLMANDLRVLNKSFNNHTKSKQSSSLKNTITDACQKIRDFIIGDK